MQLPAMLDANRVHAKAIPKFPATFTVESNMYCPILKYLATAIDEPMHENSHRVKIGQTDRSNINGDSGKKPGLVVTVDVAVDLSNIIALWKVKVGVPIAEGFWSDISMLSWASRGRVARLSASCKLRSSVTLYCLNEIPFRRLARKRSVRMTTQDVISSFRYYVMNRPDFNSRFFGVLA